MPDNNEHRYTKEDLIRRFDSILNKTLGEIDDKSIFNHFQTTRLQKGIAGCVIEQCVLCYPPDCNQQPDLIVIDNQQEIPTELKTTGIRKSSQGGDHFVAKEAMSITGVGVYDIASQTFPESHFWKKIAHMLIVYYHYLADNAVSPAEYADFPVKGYEFHVFSEDDIATLQNDWNLVHDLCAEIVSNHPGAHDTAWKNAVKSEYIDRHGELRKYLSYIELVPRFPPRFRLKKPVVNAIVTEHFGDVLEQLPGRYTTISDIDRKCLELEHLYAGKTIGNLAELFGVPKTTATGSENKGIAEQIVVKMFGGKSKKLNQIALFQKYGLVAKSITMTPSGGRTEDMKLYHIDFEEMTQQVYTDTEDGSTRPFEFADSELFSYFNGNEFLCILFEEPPLEYRRNATTGRREVVPHPLTLNRFLGFQRLLFTDVFLNTDVRKVWDDTRDKIINQTLIDKVQKRRNGAVVYLRNGEVSSAPNFIKSSENTVFIRGSGSDSSMANKTECVNNIRMLPQYIWIKGSAIVEEIQKQRAAIEQPQQSQPADNPVDTEVIMLPVFGEIAAGHTTYAEDDIADYEPCEVSRIRISERERYFYLRVRGDSMINAGIDDGSLVLIRRTSRAHNGDIVACLVDSDSATLKRYYKQRDGVMLYPENDAYEPIFVPHTEFEIGTARIIGVLCE